MIQELQKAFEKAESLPSGKQREIAQLILDEIQWEQDFDKTQGKLSSLAQEAREEYKSKNTKPLNLD
jgi:hypothetical protein